MDHTKFDDFRQWKNSQVLRLIEISDITKEMTVAAGHNDRVSFQMLLGEREAPIQQIWELEERIRRALLTLPREDAIRCHELLHGAAAERPEEAALCDQVARYQRILDTVIAADSSLSERMSGNKSFYRLLR